MAYDEKTADKLRKLLAKSDITEKKMFGGLCFFINGNMVAGVKEEGLIFRVGKDNEAKALGKGGASNMMLGGRKMSGMIVTDGVPKQADMKTLMTMSEKFVASLPPKEAKEKKKKK